MNDAEIEVVTKKLEKEYWMIKKGRAYYFFGGLVAAAIAIAGLSYGSVKVAIENTTFKIAVSEIQAAKQQAISTADEIDTIRETYAEELGEYQKIDSLIQNNKNEIGQIKKVITLSTGDRSEQALAAFLDGVSLPSIDSSHALPVDLNNSAEIDHLVRQIGSLKSEVFELRIKLYNSAIESKKILNNQSQ